MPEILSIAELKKAAASQAQAAAYTFHAQITGVKLRSTRSGKDYMDVEFADGSGDFTLKVWSDSPLFAAAGELERGAFHEVQGEWTAGSFGIESRQWTTRLLNNEEKECLLAGSPELRAKQAEDYAEIERLVATLQDPRLRGLCELFLTNWGERFRRTAAARDYHHARRGGLVEHVAQMMRSANALAAVYPLNRDLLLTGVLFHDSGKLWENCYPADGFEMPIYESGEMLGHITLGVELVNKLWRSLIENEPVDGWITLEPANELVRMHLLHLIASHHGEFQFGSPTLPKTPEAFVLHHVDNIDAKWEMLSETYAHSAKLASRVYERRRPLPNNILEPLPCYQAEPAEQ
jgi:3'-5' exoribonuclease